MTQQILSITRSPDQVLVVCTAAAGSSSDEALTLLGRASSFRATPMAAHRPVLAPTGSCPASDSPPPRR
ncbi:hypothetical protein ACFXDE_11945 [Kitasatospora sp. NPDC059408]|uniref:hypothetical protein n=1 Tax=Kitasatospora sp. NPDC059408 TaxID=3346823 RepID=UPI0036983E6F